MDAWSSNAGRNEAHSHVRRDSVNFMPGLQYSAIAYVRSPVGIFVEELRRELHPAHTHADAHLTVLPPRPLRGTEQQAIALLTEVCQDVLPFEITMGEVETFVPATPTVFLRVAQRAYRMRELHDLANRGVLAFDEPWPYMPHLTIVKGDTIAEAQRVLEIARQRWATYSETRTLKIKSLTLVKGVSERWLDVVSFPFGQLAAKT
jgi:2'-5' RNA ligase